MGAVMAYSRIIFLFSALFGLAAAVGYVVGVAFFGGYWLYSLIFFLILAAVLNFVSYFWSDKIVLSAYNARIVDEYTAPRLYKIVRKVANKAGIPMPKVAIIPEKTPNAFATGRGPGNAVVAATEGILELLDDDELEGVIGHEIAHIKHRDILVMSIAATVGAAISFLANMAFFGAMFGRRDEGINPIILFFVAITAPIAAMLVQMAVSRSREYYADEGGAKMVGNPKALASALHKLEHGTRLYPLEHGNPAHSSMFIVNPFRSGILVTLFSTHPPTEERIKRLLKLAENME